jgi:hypothetical protein
MACRNCPGIRRCAPVRADIPAASPPCGFAWRRSLALFVAPKAARWSTRVPVMLLRQSFAFCLCALVVRILMWL